MAHNECVFSDVDSDGDRIRVHNLGSSILIAVHQGDSRDNVGVDPRPDQATKLRDALNDYIESWENKK
tara:strand:+ start:2455 stop:2658 length:204 start_codon:yes stop_codon:yes gene_type:complete